MPINHEHQVEVSLIGDFQPVAPNAVMWVREDRDYVLACNALSQTTNHHGPLRIWVRHPSHYAWLRNFAEQIDLPARFQEKTARLLLAELWNVTLPSWLDDDTILTQGLLNLDVENTAPASFVNRLLTHLLGAVFANPVLSSNSLEPVIHALNTDAATVAFQQYPVAGRCLEDKCVEWEKNASEAWVKEVCKRLSQDFLGLWRPLSAWSILHHYPGKVLEYVLTPVQIQWVRKVPPKVIATLPLESMVREQILTQIHLFFNSIKAEVTTSEAFGKVLGCVSGRLSQEFQHILELLKQDRIPVTARDVASVREKFQSCPGISISQLNSLAYLVKPQRPTLLKEGQQWSRREWIQWTVNDYMPYREWQTHAGHFDQELEATVQRFSEWYVDHYASIHQEPADSLIHGISALAADWEKALAVILVVDCLPINFWRLLDEALRNAGFSQHDRSYRFALLPTVTEHNKPRLLAGQWENDKAAYDELLQDRAKSEWAGRKLIYVSSLRALAEMEIPARPATVVLNFIDGDEVLHEDVEARITTHEEELYRLYSRMAETVHKMADHWTGSPEDFHVHVVTDHGACWILAEETRSFDSKMVSKLFVDEKYRFATIGQDQLKEIPENLWHLGFRFQSPFGSENIWYFIPRGHNTVRPASRKVAYTHGGASPEEVIVPTGLYKPVKAAWKAPSCCFLGLEMEPDTGQARFYIQRVVTLKLGIQNPNPTAIRVVRASVLLPETDLKGCESPTVAAGQEAVLTLDCYFKKSALDQPRLEIEILYEIAGETHTILVPLASKFKSAMATRFSLKDL
ncbi:MAG: hypothetical protein HGA53_02940 [Anaerolineaceae bacterium]|nr:hypothetical protein [Anaerolineaceae bacterium]